MKRIIVLTFYFAFINLSLQSKAPTHEIWTSLLKKHVTSDGKVNYKGFISDSLLLNKYLKLLSDNKPDEKSWSANEQKAYWINAYNAFTVKLISKYYPVKSIKEIGGKIQVSFINTPWDIKFFKIGNEVYDLNKIEHEKLRKKFGDPRIHFALVCASKSCPLLLNVAFEAENLNSQLDTQARVFINDKTRNNINVNNPKISKIFDWYGGDFKTKKSTIIDYLNKYSQIKINPNATISYLDYSWNLNE